MRPAKVKKSDRRQGPSSIVDPDAGKVISCPLLDSRHTFLEMCQFWHYQFDTLRRAKHSSIMLLYHLHNPESDSLSIPCSNCACDTMLLLFFIGSICVTGARYAVCDGTAQHVSTTTFVASAQFHYVQLLSCYYKLRCERSTTLPQGPGRHNHVLTPFRITFSREPRHTR